MSNDCDLDILTVRGSWLLFVTTRNEAILEHNGTGEQVPPRRHSEP